jgi:chaperonin cofactor prefoldin
VLKEFGAEGLREEIGTTLAETSRKVSEITNQAEKLDVKMADMEDNIKDWKEKFSKLFKKEEN